MRQNFVFSLTGFLFAIIASLAVDSILAQEKQATEPPPIKADQIGPETEKRFPSPTVPDGFKATLFACDPLIEYPSVIAIGPKQGSLFVAHDYVTGLGVEIVRRDEIRLVQDTDADGYADKSMLYAGGFNSIQGLAYHAGSVYVMHSPLLTSLQDTDGDGVADKRRDLVSGLGLPPEENSNRLHCANGVVVGHDGWLYLALGDRGCDVKRPEGDRLVFRQGGILRCRTDGRDLHVFAGGMRNIYDIVLDEQLNVFVRDNENDGGDYMIRVCHSFHGADHGYPYLYYERPDEGMKPLADLGRGSSAGGTSYLETAFPREYQKSLYFCEWGRAVVRYRQSNVGSSFAPMKEFDFAAGAPTDPYGFKPTDLVVDYDGSVLISDWGDGQRPKRGRGRIYRIAHVGSTQKKTEQVSFSKKTKFYSLLAGLNSKSSFSRIAAQEEIERRGDEAVVKLKQALAKRKVSTLGRMHAIWILAHVGKEDTLEDLFQIAENDLDPRVQSQAVRALADLTDPILSEHKLSAKRGDFRIAVRLASLVKSKQDSRLFLEVMVALGRLHWSEAPAWLGNYWSSAKPDPALEHAAMQLLRRAENWSVVLELLDEPDEKNTKGAGLHSLALRAIANQTDEVVVDGLISRLNSETDSRRRGEYVDMLARVYKKPAPWTYWGFRAAPRPANTVAWKRSEVIRQSLDRALADSAPAVRMLTLKQMRREKVPLKFLSLDAWLQKEREPERVAKLLESLGDFKPTEVKGILEEVVRDKAHSNANRLTALAALSKGLDRADEARLFGIAKAIDEGPVLAELLRDLGKRPQVESDLFLLGKLTSSFAVVRTAAIEALAARKNKVAATSISRLLSDSDQGVRRAAAEAVGVLHIKPAAETLLVLAASDDLKLSRASLVSLEQLGDSRAVVQAVAALQHRETELAALSYLGEYGSAAQAKSLSKLAETSRSIDVMTGIVGALVHWKSKEPHDSEAAGKLALAVAEIQVKSGALLHWSVLGRMTKEVASQRALKLAERKQPGDYLLSSPGWSSQIASGIDATVRFTANSEKQKTSPFSQLAVSDLFVEKPENVEFLGSCNGAIQVWLNGREVFRREKPAAYLPNSDRFEAALEKGINRLVVKIDAADAETRFHLRFRQKSSKAEHERLIRLALAGRGNVQRGRELFLNAEKSQCVKCHRLGEQQTGRIGPDLTGIGSRFSRIHLIESILEPSRTVAPSYNTIVLVLVNGKVLSGVKIAETAITLTLGDKDGKIHEVARSEIEERQVQTLSTMPDSLEKKFTDQEFLDLIMFLISQKKN